ncbi:phosphoadenylylsulfate reductase (thioredoxin) [Pseudomonas sp. SLBN-26]|jgi:phosphoadenosine phosphosulfate reductase|uniref:Adenosine 5'-phosphosulfate reductase n=1 Tax=Metapseudomonas otitidis TaxID=319939 RepID=A0A1I0TI12_9GAMM|nr:MULTISPECIES: phosphoadenylyl-sulfate reductase [Pseudomonas]MBO2926543.1 phosphoadenylyl-sulfate reductase [Pseudomonas otitidis]MCO7555173.1 phosphoadenylyl-sulfate reductase [Pseudomonas otitidis]MCP1617560.1 phosphoadenosine phosphosulfate reductase [Pseudomonas otitidis]MWK54815.1 phosphoadenylyl-sulfate reductase [Pseudomonas otitidis]QZX84868.1 phosphoadenylyl-sulfate reductase [Pseudomonas otitidis]
MSHPFDVTDIAASYASKSPQEILKFAFEQFGDDLWISFSGAEDVVLVDMAWKLNKNVKVFSLDTGRLHPETYRFIDKVREHYGIAIEVLSPDAAKLEPFVREKGLFSFYKDGHEECCGIRKIAPLRRKLSGVSAWATGQRRDQSPGTRSKVAAVEVDGAFSTPEKPLYKFNPLAQMSSEEVWAYIRMLEIPYNPLHERGFISIGCEPCTRPVLPNQHEREGRWWWEEATQKECGLHAGNLIARE